MPSGLAYQRILFLLAPTGDFCREDRCQSYFRAELIPTRRPPMEECEAAGALRAIGAQAFVIDAPAAGLSATATLERVRRHAPDLIVVVVTFGSMTDDLAWATRLRAAFPDVTIGLRGAPCYVLADEMLARAPAADFCVRGEYELAFAAIAERGYPRTPGTVYRDAGRIVAPVPAVQADDLDALPRPARDVVDARAYTVRWIGRPQATVRVQRGCPFPCTYCLVHMVSGARARHRSAASIAAEMADVVRDGVRDFYLRADTFSLDRDWTLKTCAAIAEACPGARWVTTTRVECVDDAVLAAMRRAGCYGVSFGIDAASEDIGARVRKAPDLARAETAMRLCDRHGLVSLGYFMIGFLWETEATLTETARFVRAVRPDLLTIHYAHPYPGTPYHDEVRAAGARQASPRAQAEPAIESTALPPTALEGAARRMLRRHYANPRVLASLAGKGIQFALGRR